MRALIIHSGMLFTHMYFMYWTFTYYEERSLKQLWNQIKFLTNFSNVNMFWFLIPYFLTDVRNFGIKDYEYSRRTQFCYQVMTPIIFLVMAAYWGMYLINPKLLFGNRDHQQFDQFLMAYLHGGNLILMFLEYLVNPPKRQFSIVSKGKWLFTFVIIYFGIYGVHYMIFNEHVYGFQEMMSASELVMFYLLLFVCLLFFDILLSSLCYGKQDQGVKQEGQKRKIKKRD